MKCKKVVSRKIFWEPIIALYNVKKGQFAQIKPELITALERQALIVRAGGHTLRYVLPDSYAQLASKEQRIGKRYVTLEVEQMLMALQRNTLKIGELEETLADSLNRNQLKYLINKLYEDRIISSEGTGRGTKYKITAPYDVLHGDGLISSVISDLREKYASETG